MPQRVKNSQRSGATIFSGTHFFLNKSAQPNRAAKSCFKENYLQSLKYPPVIKWMFVRTLKQAKRPRYEVKNKSFPTEKVTNVAKCTRQQDHHANACS